MAIEKLSVILELVSGNYKKEAREAATATSGISGAAKTVTGSLGLMIGPAAIGGAILGLGKMALAAGENADRLFDLQTQTGLSTDALQEWEFVTAAAGAKTDAFADAVKQVIKNMDQAVISTSTVARAYDTLGVSVLDANGQIRDGGTITEEVFEKLAAMENITARNALAQDLFGKKWEETITILDLGGEALADLRQEGKKATISAESLRNADKFRETFEKIKATLQAKLFESLGKIAPALEDIAEGALDAVDALEPLIDVLGFLVDKYTDLQDAIDAGQESENVFLQFISDAADKIFSFGGGLGAFVQGWESMNEVFGETPPKMMGVKGALDELHDSWEGLPAAVGPTISLIDRQTTAFSNAAKAADTQRRAMINLADAQADLLDPVSNVLRLQKDLRDAQERLTDAQEDGETSAEDLAIAAIEVEQAFLRLQGAGAALTPDQIQAFSLILIRELGMSEQQALDTLKALNLLDGWTGTATFTLEMNKIASGGGGTGNINTDILPFHTGGVVPGPRGSDQLILAQGGEGIIPLSHMQGNRTTINRGGATINVASPSNNLPQDLQYGALLANHATFGKF